jgi:dihydrolipoamide dehydrogenase
MRRSTRTASREGVDVRLGREAIRVVRAADGARIVHLDDGTAVRGQELLVATGRTARTKGLNLEAVGARVTRHGVQVDDSCRGAPGLWAIGDVTGVALFTHVAKYQARVAADDILGRRHPASYAAVPRVVFSDPEVGATGRPAPRHASRDWRCPSLSSTCMRP